MRLELPATLWLILPDLICLGVCVAAAITDLRTRRIPNLLVLPAAAAGLVLNATLFGALGGTVRAAGVGLSASFAGGLLAALVFGLLGAIHFLGMGDVKLMVAVGTLLRWPLIVTALVDVALAGGVVALLYALARGRMGPVLGNLFRLGRRAVTRRSDPIELHRIPYAVAILLGSLWSIGARYLPALRWP